MRSARLQAFDEETEHEEQVAQANDDEADCGEAGDDADCQQHADIKREALALMTRDVKDENAGLHGVKM